MSHAVQQEDGSIIDESVNRDSLYTWKDELMERLQRISAYELQEDSMVKCVEFVQSLFDKQKKEIMDKLTIWFRESMLGAYYHRDCNQERRGYPLEDMIKDDLSQLKESIG